MRRMGGLDGLRALAIGAVVLDHSLPTRFMGGGVVDVDLFFVLSGYLITRLLLVEYGATGTISLKAFYVRRARRLLPALSAVLIVVVGVAVASGGSVFRTALVSAGLALTYSSNLARHAGVEVSPALGQLWTLALEEQFYALWPLLLFVGLRRVRPGFILCGTLGLATLSVLLRFHEAAAGGPATYYSPSTWADALLIGCVAAELDEWGYLTRVRSRVLVLFGLVPFALVLVALPPWQTLYQVWLLPLAAGNAVAVVAVAHNPPRMLASRSATWVGTRSYGLYLWHTPVLVGILALTHGSTAHPTTSAAIVAAIIAVAVAAVSYRVVEQPLRRRPVSTGTPPAVAGNRAERNGGAGTWARRRVGVHVRDGSEAVGPPSKR